MEFWFSEFHTPDVKHSIRVNRQLYSKQSDYQRIDIFETPEFGRVLTLDGNVMLTERDEFIYDCECRRLAKGSLCNYKAATRFLLEYLRSGMRQNAARKRHVRYPGGS